MRAAAAAAASASPIARSYASTPSRPSSISLMAVRCASAPKMVLSAVIRSASLSPESPSRSSSATSAMPLSLPVLSMNRSPYFFITSKASLVGFEPMRSRKVLNDVPASEPLAKALAVAASTALKSSSVRP
jgi:hypothetical protein